MNMYLLFKDRLLVTGEGDQGLAQAEILIDSQDHHRMFDVPLDDLNHHQKI